MPRKWYIDGAWLLFTARGFLQKSTITVKENNH
jgi:hypothetical protein